jgi:hypothetical protein
VRQLTTLFRQEAQLARSEISDKIGRVAAAAMTLAIGAALLMAGLVILLQAAAVALQEAGLSPLVSLLIVGVAVVVIGGVMLMSAVSALKNTSLVPDRTVDQLQRDASVAKAHTQ